MRPTRGAMLLMSVLAGVPAASAQDLWPGATHDSRIPTLKAVTGHDIGQEISTPEEIAIYLKALADAAPDRTRLVEYARTFEGRPLHVLVIGSPARMAHLDELKARLGRLADPRTLESGEVDRLVAELPVVVWLMHAVHGNEISSSDAGLAEAYHLLAATNDPVVDSILRETLVLIDPLENPDGRARFVFQNRFGRAAEPDPERLSAEHDEPWPGGRSNHYLFDMNRDWFARSQPETRGRERIALDYHPQVVVDLHEMGGDNTYYFAPPANPINPYITPSQVRWLEAFGRANAERFDERGFAYFTREVYDSFYPGYGESWPMYQGAIGMTYEQASARGLALKREDGTTLTYYDGILHHFTSALTTLATAAANRTQLLKDFLEYRRSATTDGEKAATREYVLVPGPDPSLAATLAMNLASQGIDVRRAEEAFPIGTRQIPAGAYLVSNAQPSGRLLRNLLEPRVPQPEAFVKEQDRRRKKRMRDQIYDVTAWNLPMLFDVDVVGSPQPLSVKATPVNPSHEVAAAAALPAAKVAYVMPWGTGGAIAAAGALRAGLKVHQAQQSFTTAGRTFPAGTAIFRVAGNPDTLADTLAHLAAGSGAEVVPLNSGWVDKGISLGSDEVVPLKPPRIVLAWDWPTQSLSAGWARYVLEQRYHLPVTAVRVPSFPRLDLHDVDVIVLPQGNYRPVLGDEVVRRIRDWVRNGGVLVTLGEASRWAAEEKVGLLDAPPELRDGRPDVGQKDADTEKDKDKDGKPAAEAGKPFDYDKAILPEREPPENTPGSVLRVELDREHWLSAGTDGEIQVMVDGRRVFTPIRLDKGSNVGVYADKDHLVASGLVWDDARDLLAEKAYLIEEPIGRGRVVAFAEDPNYRAFVESSELLFVNAVLLGPSQ
jgi:Zinc carboxypeptidase